MADVVLIFGVGGVFAYFSNFMGFKNWWDANVGPNFGITPGTTSTGGTGVFAEPQPAKPTTTPASVPLGKIFTYQGMNCWRNYRCGGAQVSVCGKASPETVYKSWVCTYACSKPAYCRPTTVVAKPLTPAQKCIQLAPSCKGNANPCLCRCMSFCKSKGPYHGQMKADYSCRCVKNLAARVAGQDVYSGYEEMPTVA
jgi:hypothetical protein